MNHGPRSGLKGLCGVGLGLLVAAHAAVATAAPLPPTVNAEEATAAPSLPDAPTSAELTTLADRVARTEADSARQKEDVAALRADLEREKQARAEAEVRASNAVQEALKATPPSVATKRPQIGFSGFLQSDLAVRQSSENEINGTTGDLLNQNRFYVRRARARFTAGGLYSEGALELDANTVSGPAVRPVGAEASLKLPGADGQPPLIMGTLGLFKTPFGYEIGESDRDRLFTERSAAEQALFPGEYDVGARLQGCWRFLRYMVGVMNGEPLGEKTLPGRDPNSQKDLVGRIGVDTRPSERIAIRGGFSALRGHGFHRGTAATKDVLQWRDANSNRIVDSGEIAAIQGAAPTPSFNFDRHAFGLDGGIRVQLPRLGWTTVYGELYLAENLDRGALAYDPSAPNAPSVREIGWYAAVTQELTPHFLVGARYDVYNPDRDATESRVGQLFTRDRSTRALAVTGALVGTYGRLIVEWDRNRNHLGRDLLGRPTNLKDNAFILRGQVNF